MSTTDPASLPTPENVRILAEILRQGHFRESARAIIVCVMQNRAAAKADGVEWLTESLESEVAAAARQVRTTVPPRPAGERNSLAHRMWRLDLHHIRARLQAGDRLSLEAGTILSRFTGSVRLGLVLDEATTDGVDTSTWLVVAYSELLPSRGSDEG